MKNRCKKLLCMGLAALLTVTSLPEVSAWAAEAVASEEIVAEQPEMEEEVPGTGGITDDGFEYWELADGTIEITSYTGNVTDLVIPEEIEGKKVTTIDAGAFSGHSELTSIELPTGITSIGDSAFLGCSKLSEIELPEGITSIKTNVFSECISLTSMKLPDSVTAIGRGAFWGCSGLKSIELPKDMTSIGIMAFHGCISLTSIKLPAGITGIEESVFDGCIALTSIELPENITSIGNNAFEGCSRLTSIELPENITSIGESAFEKCTGLITVKLPKNITNIGRRAFFECSKLSGIELPEELVSIEDRTFYGCRELADIKLPKNLTSIGDSAFYDCNGLTGIELPESLTSIGEDAFTECYRLAGIRLPKGIKSIGAGTFWGCSGLTSIELPEGITSIGESAFSYCSSLKSIQLPEGITEIEEYTFDGCSALARIRIPAGVTAIAETAFSDCNELTILCDDGSYAYSYATAQKLPVKRFYTVTFEPEGGVGLEQNSVTAIEGDALGALPAVTRKGYTFKGWFTEKSGGTEVTKDTIVTADLTMYAQWEEVKDEPDIRQEKQSIDQAEVTLSAGRTAYDGKAKKPSVISVKLAGKVLTAGTDYTIIYNGNTNIGTASVIVTGTGNYTGTVTKTFTIYAKKGTTVTSGAYRYKFTGNSEVAFAGIKSAKTKKVTIPKTVKIGGKIFKVTSIAKKALFNRSKVTSVTIGENVKTIGASAFGKCKRLSTITIRTTKLKSVGKNALNGVRADAKIKVPSRKLKAYRKILKNRGQGRKVTIVKQ